MEMIRAPNAWERQPRGRGVGRASAQVDEFDQRSEWDDADERAPRSASGGYPMAGPRTAAPANLAPPGGKWRKGMRITHTQFGEGTIEGVEGGGPNAKLTVLFEHGGVRKLLLRYAGKDIRLAESP
jgi:hypothetical protein